MRRIEARVFLLLLPLLGGWDPFRIANRNVEEGNALLKAGKPDKALELYDKALAESPAEPGLHFDRGNALFALNKFQDASQAFLRATEAKDKGTKAAAFYNLGNSFFKADNFDEAIAAYKRSLQLDPSDLRAKWNLEIALKKKKDEDEKKKNDQNKDDKNKDQKKDDKQDQQKQDQQKQDQQKQDQQKQDQQKQDQQKQDQQKQDQQKQDQQENQQGQDKPQPPPKTDDKGPDLPQIDAILDSLERSPKNLEQERARLRAVRRRPPVKDW